MDNVIVTPAEVVGALINARKGYVGSIKGEGLKLAEYAKVMNATFSVLDEDGKVVKGWWELKGKAGAPVKAEFEAFKTELKLAGYADGVEYTYWGRVKDASGRPKSSGVIVKSDDPDNLGLTKDDIRKVLNRINRMRENKGEAFEILEPIYDRLLGLYKEIGGEENDLK